MKKIALLLMISAVAVTLYAQGDKDTSPPMMTGDGSWMGGELTESDGLLITGVLKDGPADTAGLRRGDILLSMDGKELQTAAELYAAIDGKKGGDVVTFRVQRGDAQLDIPVTLENRVNHPALGLAFSENSRMGKGLLDRRFGIMPHPMDFNGAIVVDVTKDSAAEAAGLKSGMVIVAMDGQAINSAEDVVKAISAKKPGDTISISVDTLENLENEEENQDVQEIEAVLGEDDNGDALLGIRLGSWIPRTSRVPYLPDWHDGAGRLDGKDTAKGVPNAL